jgi:RNA polymerase sigma factor (sigma-70 family)
VSQEQESLETARIIKLLADGHASEAWPQFLKIYSNNILKLVRRFARNEEDASDCFLFVCEQLAQNKFRRLRKYDRRRGARLSTWLYSVTYNLCLDWRRTRCPRYRTFQSIAALPLFDQEVFHIHFEQNLSIQETFETIATTYPEVTRAQFNCALQRVGEALTPKQRQLIQARRPMQVFTDVESVSSEDSVDSMSGVDPQGSASQLERSEQLTIALKKLSEESRQLLHLRYTLDFSLVEIAQMLGLANAQAADRRIVAALKLMYEFMNADGPEISGSDPYKLAKV